MSSGGTGWKNIFRRITGKIIALKEPGCITNLVISSVGYKFHDLLCLNCRSHGVATF